MHTFLFLFRELHCILSHTQRLCAQFSQWLPSTPKLTWLLHNSYYSLDLEHFGKVYVLKVWSLAFRTIGKWQDFKRWRLVECFSSEEALFSQGIVRPRSHSLSFLSWSGVGELPVALAPAMLCCLITGTKASGQVNVDWNLLNCDPK